MDDQALNALTQIGLLVTGVLGGGLLAWRMFPSNKRKTDADAATSLTTIAMSLVTPLEKRIDELEKQLADCQAAMEKRVKSVERKMSKVAR